MIHFKSLSELTETLRTEDDCKALLEKVRWGITGVISPFDKDSKVYRCKNGRYKCSKTNTYFSVRTGSVFAESNIPLKKWFMALWILSYHKKGISSYALAKTIGVTQKTAWFVGHRLRHAMSNGIFDMPLENTVEADETYIGGKEANKHNHKKAANNLGYKADTKHVVLGVVERNGSIRVKHTPNAKNEHIHPFILENVRRGSRLVTDEYYAYSQLGTIYTHDTIKHMLKQYVIGDIHTNTIEGFWSLLKRGIVGIYHHMSEKHLQLYLDEFAYRYNVRKLSGGDAFMITTMRSTRGSLKYKQLVKKI